MRQIMNMNIGNYNSIRAAVYRAIDITPGESGVFVSFVRLADMAKAAGGNYALLTSVLETMLSSHELEDLLPSLIEWSEDMRGAEVVRAARAA